MRIGVVLGLLSFLIVAAPAETARAEQGGSAPPRFLGGLVATGTDHTCAVVNTTFAAWQVRCWGYGDRGRLGYGNTDNVGDDEEPRDYGPVSLGTGRTARAVAAGDLHSCAQLDDGTVRCWGVGSVGALGYGNMATIGDNETPGSVGPVDLGPGRTARAITAGNHHTCALRDNWRVLCWGHGPQGALGYGNPDTIGDNETPGFLVGVDLGAGRTARAIAAGGAHTCALLDNGAVRCWGYSDVGQIGAGFVGQVGDDETPGSIPPVHLGAGRTARAISAGGAHVCAILDNGRVRCWGYGASGRLGYGNTANIGDDEKPSAVGPVDLGAGRKARAIAAGGEHTCALLDDWSVRCWGEASSGQLGLGNVNDIGDNETPGSVVPVDLGAGRSARAIAAGSRHSCALLDNGSLRCWGAGALGRLGYGNTANIGDNETPASAGAVDVGGTIFVKGTPTLTLARTPRRDATLPIRFVASGRLVPPAGPPLAEACRGTVRLVVRRGAAAIRSATVGVRVRNGRCVYAKAFRFDTRARMGSAARLTIVARFEGNALLRRAAAKPVTIRIA